MKTEDCIDLLPIENRRVRLRRLWLLRCDDYSTTGGLYALISGTAEHGWASLMLSIWFVGGVVLLSIGAVGLYIGKIYKEVKRRPLYNVEEVLYDDQNK